MVISKKNNFKINVINLILSLLLVVPIVYGIIQLKKDFIFSDLIAIIYSTCFHIMILIVIYASLRELNPPEFLEFLENSYIQLLGFILISLLLIDTSIVGLIVGCIIITLVLGEFIYIYKFMN